MREDVVDLRTAVHAICGIPRAFADEHHASPVNWLTNGIDECVVYRRGAICSRQLQASCYVYITRPWRGADVMAQKSQPPTDPTALDFPVGGCCSILKHELCCPGGCTANHATCEQVRFACGRVCSRHASSSCSVARGMLCRYVATWKSLYLNHAHLLFLPGAQSGRMERTP
jgi:hypothetical protein